MRVSIRLALVAVLFVLLAALMACKIDWKRVNPVSGIATAQAGYATEIYGAEQFHIQLTQVAR